MPIGTSDGQYFENVYDYWKRTSDAKEMAANETSGDFESRFGASSLPPTMPPEASRKLAGALKAQSGTQVASEDPLSNIDLPKAPFGVATVGELPPPAERSSEPRPPGKTLFNTKAGPITEGDIETGIEVGMATSGGGLTFGGVRSTALKDPGFRTRMFEAHGLEMQGAHADDIWEKTGLFRGADNRWRYEIPDQNMVLKDEGFHKTVEVQKGGWEDTGIKGDLKVTVTPKGKVSGFQGNEQFNTLEDVLSFMMKPKPKSVTLGESINHPELFKAYPELKNVKVIEYPEAWNPGGKNWGMMRGDELFLKPGLTPEEARSVISHEVQHRIQEIEGFSHGANTQQFRPEKLDAAEEFFNKVRAETEAEMISKEGGLDWPIRNRKSWINFEKQNPGLMDVKKKSEGQKVYEAWKKENPEDYQRLSNIVEGERLLADEADRVYAIYKSVRGEVESRNVQDRLTMTDWERRTMPPYRTEDVPRAEQIPSLWDKVPSPRSAAAVAGGTVQYNLLTDFFKPKDTPTKEVSGDKDTGFPTPADAENARKYGFGYGRGLEPYVNNEVARVYRKIQTGDLDKVLMGYRANEDLTQADKAELRNKIGTLFGQAALAANRSAIASLGFDPGKINLQTELGKSNLAGFFSPQRDMIWMNAKEEYRSAAVHESIHRGFDILRKESPEARNILSTIPEELAVRYLMVKTMGDPEKGMGNLSDAQRGDALTYFTKMDPTGRDRKKLEMLEEIASEVFKNKRPKGPI